MQSFVHRYATGIRLRFGRDPSGGLKREALIVTANIALEPSSLGYDAQKVDELEQAVVLYAEMHYPSIILEFEEN